MGRDARVRTRSDLTGPFRPAGICVGWPTSLGLRGHLGNVGLTLRGTSKLDDFIRPKQVV